MTPVGVKLTPLRAFDDSRVTLQIVAFLLADIITLLMTNTLPDPTSKSIHYEPVMLL